MKILIVDDNPDARTMLVKVLRRLGHDAFYASSGEEAIDLLNRSIPEMMLLDVMMPGMDGLEVLRRVREHPPTATLPVVMFTAVSDPQFKNHALAKGATDYWVKTNLDLGSLEKKIAQYAS
jgi:CheY-like chemotaxis protein